MTIYEEKNALPFFAYKAVLGEMEKQDPEIYEYVKDGGFVMGEPEYRKSVSRTVKHSSSREEWDMFAKYLRDAHITNIDMFYSELKMLSDNLIGKGRVLQMGSGNGDITEGLRRLTKAQVVGIDYSSNMTKECRDRGEIILADCEKIPAKDCSFDQVLVTGVGWNDSRFDELKRVLASGGELLVDSSKSIPVSVGNITANSYEEHIRSYLDIRELRDYVNNGLISKLKSGVYLQYNDMKDDTAFLKRKGFKRRLVFSEIISLPRPFLNNPLQLNYSTGNVFAQIALAGKKP